MTKDELRYHAEQARDLAFVMARQAPQRGAQAFIFVTFLAFALGVLGVLAS